MYLGKFLFLFLFEDISELFKHNKPEINELKYHETGLIKAWESYPFPLKIRSNNDIARTNHK